MTSTRLLRRKFSKPARPRPGNLRLRAPINQLVLNSDHVLFQSQRMEKLQTKHSVTFTCLSEGQRPRWNGWRIALIAALMASAFATPLDLKTLICLGISLVLAYPKRSVVSESVMAVKDVGVQLTKRLSDGTEHHAFVPAVDIDDIVVNEAPAGFVIRTYLVVVSKKNKNFLPFEHSELSIKTSAEVLFALRNVLFDSST